MNARSIGVFFAGFAAGVVFIAILLQQTGTFGVIKASAAPHPYYASHSVPSALPYDTTRLPAPPLSEANSGRAATPQEPSPSDSPGPGPHGLLIPVTGLSPSSLRDNFNETHNGHHHEALDIMAARGTPVLAVAEGNVVKLFDSKAGGLTVYQFDDTQAWCFYYAHLDHYAQGLKEGTLLRRGDVLGYVGSSGNASPSAPHLHFTIFKLGPEKQWWQGTPIDPYPLLTGNHP